MQPNYKKLRFDEIVLYHRSLVSILTSKLFLKKSQTENCNYLITKFNVLEHLYLKRYIKPNFNQPLITFQKIKEAMLIRKAVIEDSNYIATFLLLAMEAIVCEFIGQNDSKKAKDFLLHFVQKENNQYSYQNCFVVEEEQEIIAAVNIYDGSELKRLRAPIIQYIEAHFSKAFNPEDETQSGEFYIDSLGVNPKQQGKGVGAILINFVIDFYVIQNKKTVGLLVEESNPNAKRFYLKLGFEPVGKKMLVGKKLLHLQVKPNGSL